MIALDTNVLVRLLVDDEKEQVQNEAAKSLLKSSEQVYLPQIVQVETVWVLESAYGFDKASIIHGFEHLKSHTAFQLQCQASFSTALDYCRSQNADFSDCLILSESQKHACQLMTFDRKLGRLDGAQPVHF